MSITMATMKTTEGKAFKAKMMRYKRAALSDINYSNIVDLLYEIQENCSDVRYMIDEDEQAVINAIEDEGGDYYEFQMLFSMVSGRTYQLLEQITRYDIQKRFDDCTVALIGNRYRLIGYDDVEEDYFSLTSYEEGLAETESGKRIMKLTKADMLSNIGQCMGIAFAFYDLKQQYDYLKASIDILIEKNLSAQQMVNKINKLYNSVSDGSREAEREFDTLTRDLPPVVWIY